MGKAKVPGDLYRTKNPLVLRYPHARPNGRLYGGLEISLPKNAIQTATVDRRKEFACVIPPILPVMPTDKKYLNLLISKDEISVNDYNFLLYKDSKQEI
ncbi:hypothetical protein KHT88_13700 [Alkalihalobacillus clausii]|nr:hypothetical protein DB29_00189 [Shouchella clausii]MBU3231816.1 hypothetical protein [Shouchella clausii]MBU3264900.1 hypothetical protein [Shouchella clausii]MBU3507637.1 hypothetical protein [Shouchella clausii]MBU3533280.1 hypothetical protein [Shouchella clausii]